LVPVCSLEQQDFPPSTNLVVIVKHPHVSPNEIGSFCDTLVFVGISRSIQNIPTRRRLRRGSQLVEFTLVLFPLLGFMTVLVDIAWPTIAKASMQRAVRQAVRTGITLTSSQMSGSSCLTGVVKALVQSNSMGLLNGTSGLSYIKVNYFAVPPPGSTASTTDVSTQSNADAPGNIMQVSVQAFPVKPLMPIMGMGSLSQSTLPVTVYSSDLIEPNTNPPCVGTAP
jgi:Flp pilus assembly protein TadG